MAVSSGVCSTDPVELFFLSRLVSAAAAVAAVAAAVDAAEEVAASVADSSELAGMSSGNCFQHLHSHKCWHPDWGLHFDQGPSVDPVDAVLE